MSFSARQVGLLLCGVLIIALVGMSLPSGSAHAQEFTAQFEDADCEVEIPAGLTVECGYLIVPENRAVPSGKTIRLHVAILRSHNPVPDPVIYLEGGPGGSGVLSIETWADSPILERRDIILLDQRGTGFSEPSLNCIEMETEPDPDMDPVQACRDRLVAQGIDLAAYNSAENAADVADLRLALGYDTWNLLGISYGTRLALTVMRDHPQGVRSAILDAVYPPHVNAIEQVGPLTLQVFKTLFEGCAAHAACNAAYPDLEEVFYALLEDLDADPALITGTDIESGEPVETEVYGADLVNFLFEALYDTDTIPLLPRLIFNTADGDYEDLASLLGIEPAGYRPPRQDDPGDISDSEGMNYSVECREEVPFNDEQRAIELLRDAPPPIRQKLIDDALKQFAECRIWNVPKAYPIENEPVSSDIPTLILNGTYDPITPPIWGAMAAEHLPNSFNFDFPGFGHGVTGSPCGNALILAFLEEPMQEPDASCLADLTGPDFIVE